MNEVCDERTFSRIAKAREVLAEVSEFNMLWYVSDAQSG